MKKQFLLPGIILCSALAFLAIFPGCSDMVSFLGAGKRGGIFAAGSSYNVGDVLLKDGTIISYYPGINFTEEEKSNFVGVLYDIDEKGEPRGWLGKEADTTLSWSAMIDGSVNNNKNMASGIDCLYSGYGADLRFVDEAVTDGSENWAYICEKDPIGTSSDKVAESYPAFNWVNNYASDNNLTATDYAEGWYIPSLAELYYISQNREELLPVLEALGYYDAWLEDDVSWTWSSSAYNRYTYIASILQGPVGVELITNRNTPYHALAVRAFR